LSFGFKDVCDCVEIRDFEVTIVGLLYNWCLIFNSFSLLWGTLIVDLSEKLVTSFARSSVFRFYSGFLIVF